MFESLKFKLGSLFASLMLRAVGPLERDGNAEYKERERVYANRLEQANDKRKRRQERNRRNAKE